jgi:8-oxo-dGTP diphosphatase
VAVVFVCKGKGELKAGDDAAEAKVFKIDEMPDLVFDHTKIIEDFKKRCQLSPQRARGRGMGLLKKISWA